MVTPALCGDMASKLHRLERKSPATYARKSNTVLWEQFAQFCDNTLSSAVKLDLFVDWKKTEKQSLQPLFDILEAPATATDQEYVDHELSYVLDVLRLACQSGQQAKRMSRDSGYGSDGSAPSGQCNISKPNQGGRYTTSISTPITPAKDRQPVQGSCPSMHSQPLRALAPKPSLQAQATGPPHSSGSQWRRNGIQGTMSSTVGRRDDAAFLRDLSLNRYDSMPTYDAERRQNERGWQRENSDEDTNMQ
jgi:hypothetical protein